MNNEELCKLFREALYKFEVKKMKYFLDYEKLCDLNMDLSVNNNEIFNYVCEQGISEIFEILLKDERIQPEFNNNRALFLAVDSGHYFIVKSLMEDSRVDPSSESNQAIKYAIANDNQRIAMLLFKNENVRNKLKKSNIKLYEKYNKYYLQDKFAEF